MSWVRRRGGAGFVVGVAVLVAAAGCAGSGGGGGEGSGRPYFEGRTIEILVPYSAGGGTDTGMRLLAKLMSQNIEGNPKVQVINVTGGAGTAGPNQFETKTKHDGDHVLITANSTNMPWLLGQPNVRYDLSTYKPVWSLPLGATAFVRRSTGIKTVEDLRNYNGMIKYGGAGPTGSDLLSFVSLAALGVDNKVAPVWGYDSGTEVTLAVESGEVQFSVGPSATTELGRDLFGANGVANLLYTYGTIKDRKTTPDVIYPNAPTMYDAYKQSHGGAEPSGEAWEAYLTMASVLTGAGYVIWMHGDAPQEAYQAMVAGMEKVVADPTYTPQMSPILGPYTPAVGATALQSVTNTFANINQKDLNFIRKYATDKFKVEGLPIS